MLMHPGIQEVAVAVHAAWEQQCTANTRHSSSCSAPSTGSLVHSYPSEAYPVPPSRSLSHSPGKILFGLHLTPLTAPPQNHIILLGRMGGWPAERLSQRLCTSASPEWETQSGSHVWRKHTLSPRGSLKQGLKIQIFAVECLSSFHNSADMERVLTWKCC